MDSGGKGKQAKEEKVMEGIASIALLPCGSISGHFIRLPDSICYGLHGTGIDFPTKLLSFLMHLIHFELIFLGNFSSFISHSL